MNSTMVWLGLGAIVVCLAAVLYAVYFYEEKQIIEDSELAYLYEITREHELGIADNRKRIIWLIHSIENNYTQTPALKARLDRVRRIIDGGAAPTSQVTSRRFGDMWPRKPGRIFGLAAASLVAVAIALPPAWVWLGRPLLLAAVVLAVVALILSSRRRGSPRP